MSRLEFEELLDSIVSHSWLCRYFFNCSSDIIEDSIQCFYSDYIRWYPNDTSIDVSKLKYIPQLLAILLYRISRNLYLRDIELSINDSIKDSFSLLARHIVSVQF